MAIIAMLTTYSKVTDDVANSQLRELTGFDDRRVRRSLDRLSATGVIERVPGSSVPGVGRRPSRITLPTPVSEDPGSQGTPGLDGPRVPQDADPGSQPTRTTPGPSRPASEKKYSEEISEEAVARSNVERARHLLGRQEPALLTELDQVVAQLEADHGADTLARLEALAGRSFTWPSEIRRALPKPSARPVVREMLTGRGHDCDQCEGGWVEVATGDGSVTRCPNLQVGAA
jgi:hypothetical protein